MSEQTLTVRYIPGVPEKFTKSFLIQVAHFEPDTVHITGEGVFPRISLDLPRALEGPHSDLLKQAAENLGGPEPGSQDTSVQDPTSNRSRSVQSMVHDVKKDTELDIIPRHSKQETRLDTQPEQCGGNAVCH